jgi:hypothetical protein
MLITALITGARGDWIWGREAKEMRERITRLEARLDRAEQIAERGTGLAHRSLGVAENVVERTAG